MRGNSFGRIFRIHTFGESHGPVIGVVIDGCPAGLALSEADIQPDLDRRRPGQSAYTTSRQEEDTVRILSGIRDGFTLGTPLALVIENRDARPVDYDPLRDVYRPSHADFTWMEKFGLRDSSGGGRASARETAARVAAGAVARKILGEYGVTLSAWVERIGREAMPPDWGPYSREEVDRHPLRCPHPASAESMAAYLEQLCDEGDSAGGVIRCRVDGCPPGWGEPVFDKLHADLGKAILSINACKGFETGSGFEGTWLTGSRHNDAFVRDEDGRIRTATNHSGGIQGGITNGMPLLFRAAFKPVATIRLPQSSVNKEGQAVVLEAKGRHDPCVLPRAIPIVEAMTALVLCDHALRQRTARL